MPGSCDDHDDADNMARVQIRVKQSARHTWQVPSACCVLCEGGRMRTRSISDVPKKKTKTHRARGRSDAERFNLGLHANLKQPCGCSHAESPPRGQIDDAIQTRMH